MRIFVLRRGASTALALLALAVIAVVPRISRAQHPGALHLVLAPDGNEARYRVREQLATLSFPSDAVGKTTAIHGAIVVDADGKFESGSSITVDLVSLATDNKTRDTYIRRNTLQTETYPVIEFDPVSVTGLTGKLPAAGEVAVMLHGNLMLHGITKPCIWHVKGTMSATGEITGTATTSFQFADYNIPQPSVARVLSVTDNITLELDFHFVPQ